MQAPGMGTSPPPVLMPVLVVLLLTTFLPRAALAALSPDLSFFLACGAATFVSFPSDSPDRIFCPDSSYLLPSPAPAASVSSSNPTRASPLYATARAHSSAFSYRFAYQFAYRAPEDASSFFVLRLHFFPFVPASSHPVAALSSARFSVEVLDAYALLSSFSPPTDGVVKEFFVPRGGYRDFTIKFTPDNGSCAFVNAIELLQAPPELLWKNSVTPVSAAVGSTDLALWQQQPLEMVYRLNVGGPKLNEKDTLWRTWLPDGPFLHGAAGQSVLNSTANPIVFNPSAGYTTNVAPDAVYQTQRAANVTDFLATAKRGLNFNDTWTFPPVTWTFPVEPGASYVVRLHICDYELISSVNGVGIVFSVYIGTAFGTPDLSPNDLQAVVSQSNEALYFDYAARAPSSGILTVSIGSSVQSSGGGILNGLEIMKLTDGDRSSPASRGRTKRIMIIVPAAVVTLLSAAVFAYAVLCFFLLVRKRRRLAARPAPEDKESTQLPSPYTPDNASGWPDQSTNRSSEGKTVRMQRLNTTLRIPLAEIKAATNNFHERNLIGVGGFGNVYKGELPYDGGTPVAVKRATRASDQGLREFQTEIAVLSSIRHRQLVSLIGYCNEQAEMILVYEYMEKGTLRSHLYGSDEPALSWKQRLEICIGAAQGLHYLHSGHSDSENIIHRDVKSSNILLSGRDGGVIAKVADFGLSRIGPSFGDGETHVSTVVKGSFGYIDPEYFQTQELRDRSDVYSFGVVLLEVLCARPVIDHSLDEDKISITNWAVRMHGEGQLDKIVDARIAGEVNESSLRKFVETAEKCLADCINDRPIMGEVVWNLEYCQQLQQTHVNIDAFEDSGGVTTQFHADVVVPRLVPSATSLLMDEADETAMSMMDVADSQVFSQRVSSGADSEIYASVLPAVFSESSQRRTHLAGLDRSSGCTNC